MLELFQKILKDKLTPNQLLLLYGIQNSISFPVENKKEDATKLIDEGCLVYKKPKFSLTAKGKKICAKYNNLYNIRKKRTSIQLMGKGYGETYDYTWEEVAHATVMYVNAYKDTDYLYMKTSQYFICKQDKHKIKHSELADYCDMVRDGVTEIKKDHFKEKVV